jgi:NAD(P)-dependent dehydrogenase (short-subunit alcohol dehydrogenase family)
MPMSGPAEFTGKAAIITGSSGGIGLRVAEMLAEAGANVFINGPSAERGERAEARLRDGHLAATVPGGEDQGLPRARRAPDRGTVSLVNHNPQRRTP